MWHILKKKSLMHLIQFVVNILQKKICLQMMFNSVETHSGSWRQRISSRLARSVTNTTTKAIAKQQQLLQLELLQVLQEPYYK